MVGKMLIRSMIQLASILSPALFAQIVIDAGNQGPVLPANPIGICLSYPTDDDAYFPDRTQTHAQAISAMKAGSLRWPMGTMADNYLWHTPGSYATAVNGLAPCIASDSVAPYAPSFCADADGSFKPTTMDMDEFMTLCRQTNTEPVVMVNAFGHLLAGAKYSYAQIKANAVEMVRYANITRGYNIRFWEIGNELSVAVNKGTITVNDYIALFNDFSVAMKQVDPTIKTGLGLGFDHFTEVLAATRDNADFVVPHQYVNAYADYTEYLNDTGLVATTQVDRAAAAVNAMAEPYKSKIKILVTEFSSHSPQGSWATSTNDIGKSLVTFELAAKMLRLSDRIERMHFWVTHSPWTANGYGSAYANCLDRYLRILPQGRAIQMLNQFALARMITVAPVQGPVRVFATRSPAGSALSVFLLNKDTLAATRTISLTNYTGPQSGDVWTYQGDGQPGATAASIAKTGTAVLSGGLFTVTLPPVSVTAVSFNPLVQSTAPPADAIESKGVNVTANGSMISIRGNTRGTAGVTVFDPQGRRISAERSASAFQTVDMTGTGTGMRLVRIRIADREQTTVLMLK